MTRDASVVFQNECIDVSGEGDLTINIYHKRFFCWSFHKVLEGITGGTKFERFCSGCNLRKEIETVADSSLQSLMSCRLREGYTVNEVRVVQGEFVEVKLSLPWKLTSMLHYVIQSAWPPTDGESGHKCKVTIYLEGDYDTLHDIVCQKKKQFASSERNVVILKFYTILQHLTRVDKLLMHLESFAHNSAYHTVPEGIAMGVPLFHLSQTSSVELYQPDFPHTSFAYFWRPISSLDINVWHRWMHTHRVNIVLTHDAPLPKYLTYPNSSGRYAPVQSRKAALKLTNMLKEFSTFTLLENSSYIKILNDSNSHPSSFYMIRITSKPPCVVLWLAFPGGTPGTLRYAQSELIKKRICELRLEQRGQEQKACNILEKPLEKILVRYQKIPANFANILDVSQSLYGLQEGYNFNGGLFKTLAIYLRPRRYIWTLNEDGLLSGAFISRLLMALLQVRLRQGFVYAHSHNGVQTMINQYPVDGSDGDTAEEQTLLVQYVLFPPRRDISTLDDLQSEDNEDLACLVPLNTQIVSEVWTEPQNGQVNVQDSAINGKTYEEISSVIFSSDREIIETMTTMEHVNLMCSELKSEPGPAQRGQQRHPDAPVKEIPFSYNVVKLVARAPQTEVLLSTFIQEFFAVRTIEDVKPDPDERANERLMDVLHSEIQRIADREIVLSREESKELLRHLCTRRGMACCALGREGKCASGDKNRIEKPIVWKCYVRWISAGNMSLILVPKSYVDVRRCAHVAAELVEFCPMVDLTTVSFPYHPEDHCHQQQQSKLRKRTQSIDNSDAPIGERDRRRNSISCNDAKVEQQGQRPRTHTFSYVNRGFGRGRLRRGEQRESGRANKMKFIGSLTVPVLFYECREEDLVEAFLSGVDKAPESVCVDARRRLEENKEGTCGAKDSITFTSSDQQSQNDFLSIYNAYIKSYVTVLFRCLQQGLPVHQFDIQQAIDYCESEMVSSIQLGSFLENVCSHMSRLSKGQEGWKALNCQESSLSHAFMRKKFSDMVENVFTPVPACKSFFYFKSDRPSPWRRQRRDTRDIGTSSNQLLLDEEIIPQRQQQQNEQAEDHSSEPDRLELISISKCDAVTAGSLSALSHLESEPSESSFSLEGPDENDVPLFLQLNITLRSNTKSDCRQNLHEIIPVTVIPTCVEELVKDTGIDCLDEKNLFASLDLVYITLPVTPVSVHISNSTTDGSPIKFFSLEGTVVKKSRRTTEGSTEGTSSSSSSYDASSDHLPLPQNQAIRQLREEIQWMLDDEVVYSMTRTNHVTHEILERVTNHIMASPNRPGCSIQAIPLVFVFGQAISYKIFSRHLDTLEMTDFSMIQDGKYKYFLQKSTGSEKDQSEVFPSYWLIVKITQDEVDILFQYREGQLTSVLPWRQAQMQLIAKINQAVKSTNQEMLLRDLHDTRFCNRLLEAETNEELWDEADNNTVLEASLRLKPGYFSCPEVWRKQFPLHPRLVDGQGSLGVTAFRTALAAFAVTNRKDMFAYMDDKKDVFYFRIAQKVLGSSVSGMNTKRLSDIITDCDSGSYTSSGGSASHGANRQRSQDSESSSEVYGDCVELVAFGVSEPGSNIKVDLVSVLNLKLNEMIVDKISKTLQRNPHTKLSPDDVRFLQKPGSEPSWCLNVGIDDQLWPHMSSLSLYFKQNLTDGLVIQPRYSHSRIQFKGDLTTSDFYLFNHVANYVGGHRGIVCIAVSVLQGNEANAKKIDGERDASAKVLILSGDDSRRTHFRFQMWEQGWVDRKDLEKKLKACLQSSIWELHLELLLAKAPLSAAFSTVIYEIPGSLRFRSKFPELTQDLHFVVDTWLPLGLVKKVPSLHHSSVSLSHDCELKLLLKDVLGLLEARIPGIIVHLFKRGPDKRFRLLNDLEYVHSIESQCLILGDLSESLKRRLMKFKDKNPLRSEFVDEGPVPLDMVSRQCCLAIKLGASKMECFVYNISGEVATSFTGDAFAIVSWVNSRADLYASVASQKVGVFHNQPFTRKSESKVTKKYPATLTMFDLLIRHHHFPRDRIRGEEQKQQDQAALSLYRNQWPKRSDESDGHNYHNSTLSGTLPLIIASLHHKTKDLVSVIRTQLQQHHGEVSLNDEKVQELMRHSRPVHFCLTPILFLPHWRKQAFAAKTSEKVLVEEQDDIVSREEVKVSRLVDLIADEYMQYAQAQVGFIPVQKMGRRRPTVTGNTNDKKKKLYLQKCVFGGILIMEIGMKRPFFSTTLHVFETTQSEMVVAETERIKAALHLHSFTFDFHLRMVSRLMLRKQQQLAWRGYDVHAFLLQFMTYYSKSPNSSRNVVARGGISFSATMVQPRALFHYLLQHAANFDLESVSLQSEERVLLAHGGQIRLGDGTSSTFDLTLVVAQNEGQVEGSQKKEDNEAGELKLHFFVVLVNQRELYPASGPRVGGGQFRPVDSDELSCLEPPFYVGYYSPHEEAMAALMRRQREQITHTIVKTLSRAQRECRKDSLWQKICLQGGKVIVPRKEMLELLSMVQVQELPELSEKFTAALIQSTCLLDFGEIAEYSQPHWSCQLLNLSDGACCFVLSDNDECFLMEIGDLAGVQCRLLRAKRLEDEQNEDRQHTSDLVKEATTILCAQMMSEFL